MDQRFHFFSLFKGLLIFFLLVSIPCARYGLSSSVQPFFLHVQFPFCFVYGFRLKHLKRHSNVKRVAVFYFLFVNLIVKKISNRSGATIRTP